MIVREWDRGEELKRWIREDFQDNELVYDKLNITMIHTHDITNSSNPIECSIPSEKLNKNLEEWVIMMM